MIEIVNFSKSYSSFPGRKHIAVKDVSFSVPKNSITGLLGRNGAGKTTLIKAVCSIHYATEGKIFVYNKENKKFDTSVDIEESKRLIGYVSEIPQLYKNFTVIEYLKMIFKMWNMTDNHYFEKTTDDFNLKNVLSQKISSLSKGYCQRVNFAAALIHNPEILILDEPSSGLDPNQIVETRKIIKSFSRNKTILLSTHIMQEAENLCDNVAIIDKGSLLAEGSIEKIKTMTKAKNLEDAYTKLVNETGRAK